MVVKRVPLREEPISGADTVELYDEYARRYMLPEYRYFVRKILRRGIRSGRVLDIGTGSGRLAIELAKARGVNFEITGLDISPEMLKKASENAREAGAEDRVKFVPGSAAELPFPDRHFDLVISYASLHHWEKPVAVLDEAYRVTANNGAIIIRDNRRVTGNCFWDLVVRTFLCFVKKTQRHLWPRSILASYTIPEVKELLSRSKIRNYRVSTDYVGLDICIEAFRGD